MPLAAQNSNLQTWTSSPFWQHVDAPNMAKSNTQAINYPYPTTNTPPLTIHHTLIVCEAVRHGCPCDNDRNAKIDNCASDVSMSDQFSRKQLQNATIVVLRRQKPSTNALDRLYLPCADCMLEARWVEGCAGSLLRCTGVWQKSCCGLSFTHDGMGFHPMGGGVTSDVSTRGGNPQSLTLTLCYPDHFTLGRFTCLIWIWFE